MATIDRSAADLRASDREAGSPMGSDSNGAQPSGAVPGAQESAHVIEELETQDWLESLRDVFHARRAVEGGLAHGD